MSSEFCRRERQFMLLDRTWQRQEYDSRDVQRSPGKENLKEEGTEAVLEGLIKELTSDGPLVVRDHCLCGWTAAQSGASGDSPDRPMLMIPGGGAGVRAIPRGKKEKFGLLLGNELTYFLL